MRTMLAGLAVVLLLLTAVAFCSPSPPQQENGYTQNVNATTLGSTFVLAISPVLNTGPASAKFEKRFEYFLQTLDVLTVREVRLENRGYSDEEIGVEPAVQYDLYWDGNPRAPDVLRT